MNQIEPEGKEKQLLDEDEVEDEAEKDETVRPVQYEITSFGADYDAEGLVKRLQRGDIYIPPFLLELITKRVVTCQNTN